MKMTPGQNKRLHALLTETGMMEHKKDLVLYFTANRSDSSKDLEQHQAQALIQHLADGIGAAGYSPPRGLALSAQPAPAPEAAPTRRGRSRPAAPKAPPTAEQANRMRRKIFAIGRAIGWLTGSSADDLAMNRAKLDSFLVSRSYLKKPLSSYAPAELPKLVAQFELIEKQAKQSAENREAGAAVVGLLAELGLPTGPAPRSTSSRKFKSNG